MQKVKEGRIVFFYELRIYGINIRLLLFRE